MLSSAFRFAGTDRFLALLVILLCTSWSAVALAEDVDYLRDVRPVLANNCFACHGADENSREADLRLDIVPDTEVAQRAIVAGDPSASELVARITSQDPELVMPPIGSGHELAAEQIKTLTDWVKQGAVYQQHWAFVPPNRPDVPQQIAEHPFDAFIRKKLADDMLQPNPPASPHVQVRRLFLDLTGLPPTPEIADRFAADPSDANWSALVDELLSSPAFGEHWASMWLDLARYADTKGYEKDQQREIWRYRDWVIDAFNRDLPYDLFTQEQLAGDLLPNATTEQILATAFHRNTMTNDEGGTDNEEFRIAAVKDRVDTTVQVWMGLTMGCAKCHSHKYDPITQQEYYQFMAYFNQTEDADRPDDAPRIATPTSAQLERQKKLQDEFSVLQQKLNAHTNSPDYKQAQAQWEASRGGSTGFQQLRPVAAESENGSTLTIEPSGYVFASGEMPPTDIYDITVSTGHLKRLTAIRILAGTDERLPRSGPGRNASDPNFVLSEITATIVNDQGEELKALKFASAKADFSQNGWDVSKAIDGNNQTGWAISPKFGTPHYAIFALDEPVELDGESLLRLKLSQQYKPASLLMGYVQIIGGDGDVDELMLTNTEEIRQAAAIDPAARTKEQQQLLNTTFRQVEPRAKDLSAQVGDVRNRQTELNKQIPKTPVMKDLPENKRRQNFVHVRGNFLEHGDPVDAELPTAFGGLTDDAPHSRLAVANWLLSKQNPLTARVAVNRVWARFFGVGLVATEEDFGTQGELPSHPELLDWMAVEFRDTHEWSLKKLCRQIVMSETYRQSSEVTDINAEIDPDGRLLSRSPRVRLSAEVVRDQALEAAGLLSNKVGGPSVMPPQPEGIWRTTYSKLKWQEATGEDRYRRALYTFWRRTSPYPSMITFDAGSREVCQIRRVRTNTPLQALITMNDPVFVEAAGGLATSAEGTGTQQQIESMFRRLLVRSPTGEEIQRLMAMYDSAVIHYGQDHKAASDMLTSARVTSDDDHVRIAARIVVASILLNLDETLSRP